MTLTCKTDTSAYKMKYSCRMLSQCDPSKTMRSFAFLVVFPTLWVSLSCSVIPHTANTTTLKLIHVLFRHGDRNPDESSLIPNSTYYDESYYPEGYGQLTDKGKRTEYRIGVRLRQRYNDFLGETWYINYIDARTTDVNRTKMSIELELASLYPPAQWERLWSEYPWIPIPYNYVRTSKDKETLPWQACSNFSTFLNEVLESDEIVAYGERYSELLEILSNKTGSSSINLASPFNYYFGFVTQEELGYPLDSWVSSIYPEPIHSAAIDYYYYITNTTKLRRIVAGSLLKKILTDSAAKINNTISPSSRKVFIYSAHEMNVASLLLSLDAYKITDVPPYGGHVLVELHEIDSVWGFKLFYQNYLYYDPIPVTIPGCDEFCPYDEFYSLVENILPVDEC